MRRLWQIAMPSCTGRFASNLAFFFLAERLRSRITALDLFLIFLGFFVSFFHILSLLLKIMLALTQCKHHNASILMLAYECKQKTESEVYGSSPGRIAEVHHDNVLHLLKVAGFIFRSERGADL